MWLAFLIGLGGLLGLTAWQGLHTMARTLGVAGWRTLWLVPLFILPLGISTWGWSVLFSAEQRPGPGRLLFARWVGFAVNQLLPVARVGGELVRTRLALGDRGAGTVVAATVIADKTAQVASVAIFALIGLGALAERAVAPDLVGPGLLGILSVSAAGFAFYVTQRRGGVGLAGRWLSMLMPASGRGAWRAQAHETQERLSEIYGTRAFLAAILANVLFRLGLTLEVWLALHLLGHPATFTEALILEGVNQVLRAAAFMIPGALGAQETGFLVLGGVLGIPPPVALSVSLCKRARELLVGLPALLAWQCKEGRGWWAKARAQRG